MARRDGHEVDERHRRRRNTRSPSPLGKHDWTAGGDLHRHSLPHRSRREELQIPETRTSSRRQSHGASIPRSSTMPLLQRSLTNSYKHRERAPSTADQISGTDRRSTSGRDLTPPSGRYHTSTPVSKRSSQTSLTGSDKDSAISHSTQEDAEDPQIPSSTGCRDTPDSRRRRRRKHRAEASAALREEDAETERDTRRGRGIDDSPSRTPRHPSSRRSSPPRNRHRRVQSLVELPNPPRSSKRSSKRLFDSEIAPREPRLVRRSNTTGVSQAPSIRSVASSRRSSVFENIFSFPTRTSDRPVKVVSCVVCLDDLPSHRTARLKCGHRMCNSCLKRSFKLSITDPQHMPPTCCTADHIPLKHVDRLFDISFKKAWNKKFAEFSTRNRLYCPRRGCGEWIKPESIHKENGRRFGKCKACKIKVCGACNGRWHTSRDCPRDDDTNKFLEQAKQEGWQRCHSCKSVVELKEGCNHMTCRCGAEFCMICGTKWKNCECPWFNYDSRESDPLDMMNIPIPVRPDRFDHGLPSPRESRAAGSPLATVSAPAMRPRPQNYDEERLLRQLRQQRDENLARRLRSRDEDEESDYEGGIGEVVGVGNSGGHFLNEDFKRRPQNILMPRPPCAPILTQFDPPSPGADYVAGVGRARGLRSSSMERRLADRFSPQRSGPMPPAPLHATAPILGISPTHAHPHAHPHVHSLSLPMSAPAPLFRRHTMEGHHMYNTNRMTRPSERVIVGRGRHDYEVEAAAHSPSIRGRRREEPRMSTLAGLTGLGRGMNRVFEWRSYVEPGAPTEEAKLMVGRK